MKLLTVSTLLCAMVALGTAAAEHHVEKRAASCPSGWTQYGNRCFLYDNRQMTWAQAQRICQSLNANLASVNSNDEYQFIRAVISSASRESGLTWVGGSDGQQENYWFWIDGTYFTFTQWCQGEPNNAGGNEHCLMVNSSGSKCWNDGRCDSQYPFICVRAIC
ncbi:ladderlectin-like [Astatotilapia calliptera]|uniref:ladderlectin-like n=1 Tax=Astatotilapia calliptera TaxID=8154 RepID=UPI000E41537C|nr:ladderlectin-like [Astatotilapia calliptera]